MDTSLIEIDRTTWPLVRIRFPSAPVQDTDFVAYLAALSRLGASGTAYATLTDLGAMQVPITAHQRWLFDDWMERAEPELAPLAAGNAIVAPSPLARAVAHTVYWHWRNPPRHRVFRSSAPAERWCARRLARAGRRAVRSAVASTAPLAPSGDVLALAPVLDLYDEPAFLLDPRGEVRFVSRVARSAYPPPYDWLRHAMSAESGAEGAVELRTVVLPNSNLRIVIVDDATGLADLPPSLRKVAQRLRLGESDKDIAAATGLAVSTVRTYVRRLYARMGVHGRRELMARRRPT